MADEVEPIADDELLYRRVPASTGWFDPSTKTLKPEAFGPHKLRDLTGISVTRAKFKSIEQAAQGKPGKSYFVAVLCVGDLRNAKFTVKPQPNLPGGYDISHAELPDLNAGNYKATETLERQRELVEKLCLRVEGPFKAEEGRSLRSLHCRGDGIYPIRLMRACPCVLPSSYCVQRIISL